MTALLDLRQIRRDYPTGEGVFTALKDVTLQIQSGEFIAIVGASGSGKSTLMNILGCLDRPTQGIYQVVGRATARLSPDELAQLRREHFGFIFQRYNLLADLTALENVEVPAIYAGEGRAQRLRHAAAILKRLKLKDRLGYRPGQLSGGQQQRVSIGRALMNGGQVILADEPTGALDSHVGEEVLTILKELHARGHTILIVTHDPNVAGMPNGSSNCAMGNSCPTPHRPRDSQASRCREAQLDFFELAGSHCPELAGRGRCSSIGRWRRCAWRGFRCERTACAHSSPCSASSSASPPSSPS
jgi:ABC-type lipoprotein export system ATPase subunit